MRGDLLASVYIPPIHPTVAGPTQDLKSITPGTRKLLGEARNATRSADLAAAFVGAMRRTGQASHRHPRIARRSLTNNRSLATNLGREGWDGVDRDWPLVSPDRRARAEISMRPLSPVFEPTARPGILHGLPCTPIYRQGVFQNSASDGRVAHRVGARTHGDRTILMRTPSCRI